MSRILVVEDEDVIRSELARLLARTGHDVVETGSVPEAMAAGAADGFDMVIADLRLPGELGTTLIDSCRPTPVLVMTSYATVRAAVEAMQKGAADFVAKPFDHDEFLLVVDRVLRQSRLQRQNAALKQDLERSYAVHGMVGSCPAMREVFERVRKVAATDATVLILGESGTGKELVARAVHDQSSRHDAPIIAVNCASIPETLIESELFGHEKGAFTGAHKAHPGLVEAADGGTLFLDEIGELPLPAQARLLRVLQEGEVRRVGATGSRRVNVRLMAATHRELRQMSYDGQFRNDLYFRLRVVRFPAAAPGAQLGRARARRFPAVEALPPPQQAASGAHRRGPTGDLRSSLAGKRPRAGERHRARRHPQRQRADHPRSPGHRRAASAGSDDGWGRGRRLGRAHRVLPALRPRAPGSPLGNGDREAARHQQEGALGEACPAGNPAEQAASLTPRRECVPGVVTFGNALFRNDTRAGSEVRNER
jgi:DNA-binding response OmpR family regulator